MATLLAAKGLGTFNNELGLKDGLLLTADNIVIDRDDVITPRRGITNYGTIAPCCGSYNQTFVYKERLIAHDGTKLYYDSCCQDGCFTQFSGCIVPLESGIRLKGVEANGNLYFTTSDGIKKLAGTLNDCCNTNFVSTSGFITNAGGAKALDTTGNITFECGGFLPPLSKTAYRVVWGIKDANVNLVLGSPSSRYVIANTDSDRTVRQVSSVTAKAIACTPCSSYFLFYDGSCNGYFSWYDKTACHTAAEPSASDTLGKTAFRVNLCAGDSACTIAAKTANAINCISTIDVSFGACCNIVLLTNNTGDVACCAINGATSTTYTITTPTAGSLTCGSFANVCVTFTVPSDVTTTNYFYQLYRTGIVTATSSACVPCLEPGDEMNLVFETAITSCNLTSGSITVKDTSPDCFRESGDLLYTNPVSGDGILQANEKPPIAKDVELFRGSVFYANTSTVQREQFNVLSVSCLTTEKSKFIVGNACSAREYTFTGGTEAYTITTVADVTDSLNGDYVLINSASDEKKYFFWFESVACTVEPCTAETAGRIAVKISTCSCDSANTIATKLEACISTLCIDFTTSVCANVITVTNTKNGNTVDVANGACCSPGFSYCVTTQGIGEQPNTGSSPSTIPAACVTPACCSFTETAHGFCTGVRGQFTTTCTDLPSGLSVNTDYFIIKVDANTFKVATSRTNALAGTAVAIADAGTGTHTYTTRGGDVRLSSLISPSQSIDETARSLVNIINRDGCGIVNAFYLSSEDNLPGQILLESKNLADTEFYIAVQDDCTDITAQFSPKLDNTVAIASMAGACSCTKTIATTSCAHGLIVNDSAFIYDAINSTFGKYTVSAVCGLTFTITQAFTATSTGRVFDINQTSDNEDKPNRLFFSKSGIPESVPLVNFIDVGGRDSVIERIIALRDNLFVMKEDGVYIVTGESGTFNVRLLDNSTFILAPDSAAVLNNQIYMLSSQGVATVSDTGIGVVSRPIEDRILDVANERFNYRTASFGVGYESDRSYILWLPTETTDTVATQAYRFNTFNRSWVRWDIPARGGIVNKVDDKLYIAAGDVGYIKQERKNNDRTDFADQQSSLCIRDTVFCACCPFIELSTVACIDIGDALVQTQYMTAGRFNRLLRKLDTDAGLTCADYLSSLELSTSECSAQSLLDLQTKLNADDCTVCYTTPSAVPSTFTTIRTEFNTLTTELNCCSTKAQFHNYATISACCGIEYESLVTAFCLVSNQVCLASATPLLSGAITQYKGIKSVVDWAPQHFGDPSMSKQVPSGTIVFDGNNFYDAIVGYSTDLSKDFDENRFKGQGTGFWGAFLFEEVAWSGEGTDVPHRALVPRQKQRCRYMTVRFKHDNAREGFTVLGVSLDARPLSTRAYRGISNG